MTCSIDHRRKFTDLRRPLDPLAAIQHGTARPALRRRRAASTVSSQHQTLIHVLILLLYLSVKPPSSAMRVTVTKKYTHRRLYCVMLMYLQQSAVLPYDNVVCLSVCNLEVPWSSNPIHLIFV